MVPDAQDPQQLARLERNRKLGKYRLIAELGAGGMAEVFLAIAVGTAGFNKLMVLKVLRAAIAEDPEFLAMFLDEARLAAMLHHPNVVQTNEVGDADGRHFIAMEYLDGQSLSRVRRTTPQDSRFDLALHLRVLSDVLAGLHYAHELCDFEGNHLCVVHRDVSPHNVYVTYDGQVKLLDFGIAKALTSSTKTSTGVLKGKLTYMAPEQACGEAVDRRADIFAVGVMLWEAVAKRKMWNEAEGNIMTRLVNGRIPPLREAAPSVPADIGYVVDRALAPNADDRYDTAAVMRADLQAIIHRVGRPSDDRLSTVMAALFENERALFRTVLDKEARKARTMTVEAETVPRLSVLAGFPPESSSAIGVGALVPTIIAESPPPALRSPSRRLSYGLLGASAVVGLGLLLLSREHRGAKAPVANPIAMPAEASALPLPSAASRAKTIDLHVVASPADAQIFVDDAQVIGNPAATSFLADDREHVIRVEALGYTSVTKQVLFDVDVTLNVRLEKAPTEKRNARQGEAVPSTKSATERRARAAPSAGALPTNKLPGQRPLEWKDPW